MPEGMVVKSDLQFMVNDSAAVFERIRTDIFAVFSHTYHLDFFQSAGKAVFCRDDSIDGIAFLICFRLEIVVNIIFAIHLPIFLLNSFSVFQRAIQGIAYFNGANRGLCFCCPKVPGRLLFFLSFLLQYISYVYPIISL